MTIFENIVRAVNRDATMLFPQNCMVLEIIGDDAKDVQMVYGGKLYNAKANTLTEALSQKIEPSPYDLIKELSVRIEALERK
jgi:hypothetical protein